MEKQKSEKTIIAELECAVSKVKINELK